MQNKKGKASAFTTMYAQNLGYFVESGKCRSLIGGGYDCVAMFFGSLPFAQPVSHRLLSPPDLTIYSIVLSALRYYFT